MSPRRGRKASESVASWKWEEFLGNDAVQRAANVLAFPHTPLYSDWRGTAASGCVGEVSSASFPKDPAFKKDWRDKKHFWHVEVVKYAGYFCQIRFLGFPSSQSELIENFKFWLHCKNVKEIGHFRKGEYSNVPPFAMNATDEEVQALLFNSIYNHFSVCRVDAELVNSNEKYKRNWPIGSPVETIDKNNVRLMCRGVVRKEIGRRLYIKYCDFKSDNKREYWAHDGSDLIKPPGWSKTVGAELFNDEFYLPEPLSFDKLNITDPKIEIKVGMLFEMVNPIRRNEIATGKVTKVLEHGFFLCRIVSWVTEVDLKKHCNAVNEFHFHITSDFIFPCGTSQNFGQRFSAPGGEEHYDILSFDWRSYFYRSGTEALPFPEKRVIHRGQFEFKKGMWLEAVDFFESELVCPAMIVNIMSPYVMKIRYYGWGEKFDQWKSIDSKEVFPIGWCQLVNHALSSPGTDAREGFLGYTAVGRARVKRARAAGSKSNATQKKQKSFSPGESSSNSNSVSSEYPESGSSSTSRYSGRKITRR